MSDPASPQQYPPGLPPAPDAVPLPTPRQLPPRAFNGAVVAAMVLGITGLVLLLVPFADVIFRSFSYAVLEVLAVLLGLEGVRRATLNRGQKRVALAGLGACCLTTVGIVVYWLIWFVVIGVELSNYHG